MLYEDEERVVYYDLEADSCTRNLLLSPDTTYTLPLPCAEVPSAAKWAGETTQIFPRQQQALLLNLGDSGDGVEEEGNPFATLLAQQQPIQKARRSSEAEDAIARSDDALKNSKSSVLSAAVAGALPNEGTRRIAVGKGGTSLITVAENNCRPILKSSQQCNDVVARTGRSFGKQFGFEAASSRPERWRTRKPSVTDTANRRKSLGAIQKRRSSQREASFSKRRKSVPACTSDPHTSQSETSMISSNNTSAAFSITRSLSDVLQRATTISQQQNLVVRDSSLSQAQVDENATAADAIHDTAEEMRADPFVLKHFSPTKTYPAGASVSRKALDDSIALKIHGNIGDVIRKATRKRSRDLTLLRSHGQHLLPEQSSHSLAKAVLGAVESVQDRAWIVVRLKRRCTETPHFVLYECQIHKVAASLEKSAASALRNDNSTIKAHFDIRASDRLRLSDEQLLKIHTPFHFVKEVLPAGSTREPEWFMLGTQLAERLEGSP